MVFEANNIIATLKILTGHELRDGISVSKLVVVHCPIGTNCGVERG